MLPVELTKGSVAFSRGAPGLSYLQWCFESILGVTIESVQGNQVYLECIGKSGSFGMVARPVEFLLSVQLKPPPLQLQRECWDSFPEEVGKGTLISR